LTIGISVLEKLLFIKEKLFLSIKFLSDQIRMRGKMKSVDKSMKNVKTHIMDPNLWDRLVWQKAFDKALREQIQKQNKKTVHKPKNQPSH